MSKVDKRGNPLILLSEADVKSAITDYLQIGSNQGKWWFCRLNAGSFVLFNPDGSHRRRVQGVEKGTADYQVLQPNFVRASYKGEEKGEPHPVCRVTFLEVKSSAGKQSPDQKAFESKAKKFHARYFIVRSVDEVQEILK